MRGLLAIASLLVVLPGFAAAQFQLPPAPPGAALQFMPCFPDTVQRETAIKAIRKALRDPDTGERPDVRSSCSDDFWLLGTETVAVWLTPLPPGGLLGGNAALRALVDAARRDGLGGVSLITDREMFGWTIDANMMDALRRRVWDKLPKRLSEKGRPDRRGPIHVEALTVRLIEPDTIRTDATGFYDVGPDTDFRLRVTDVIQIDDGKLVLDSRTRLTIDTSLYEWLAGLFTVVLPPLGLHMWDAIDQALMRVNTPDTGQTMGELVVQFAPNQVLLDAGQKVEFRHTRFLVDADGVSGGGLSSLEVRDPSVSIEGTRATVADRSRTKTLQYTAIPYDLRATTEEPLEVRWFVDGVQADPDALRASLTFQKPAGAVDEDETEHQVRVEITDVDDLEASRTIRVRIRWNLDGRPAVCRAKPWMPQCGPGRDRF